MEKTELELLKEKAKVMGVKYKENIGVDTLRNKINAVMTDTPEEAPVEKKTEVVKETIPARNARMRKEANKLVRCQISCMNPNKNAWEGEFIEVSNSAIGSIKVFVPFKAEDGWHIPQVILNVLEERHYMKMKEVTRNGRKIKESVLQKEFAIQKLPALTIEELKVLAARQVVTQN